MNAAVAAALVVFAGLLAGAQVPAFDAATVRRNVSGMAGMETLFQASAFRAQNHPVHELIRYAWEVPAFRVVDGPEWIRTERYDVTAKAPAQSTRPELAAMLRTLLIERFKLRVRREMRELPIYALVLARDDRRFGPQLRPASADACRPTGPSFQAGQLPRCGALLQNPGVFAGRSVTLDLVARDLSQHLERLVVDRTGVAEPVDLDLKYTPGLGDAGGTSVFTAIQEQLGLRLDSQRAPVEVVVVEAAERPSEN